MTLDVSRHANTRLQQRGMRREDIELIERFGSETSHGYFLRHKDRDSAISKLRQIIRRLERLGDHFIPVDNGVVLTAYWTTHKKQKKVLRSSRHLRD